MEVDVKKNIYVEDRTCTHRIRVMVNIQPQDIYSTTVGPKVLDAISEVV